MNPHFWERVSERFSNNFFNVLARENEMITMESSPSALPSIDDFQRAFENFLIKIPGVPLILLYAFARESVVTLQSKTQERTWKVIESTVPIDTVKATDKPRGL